MSLYKLILDKEGNFVDLANIAYSKTSHFSVREMSKDIAVLHMGDSNNQEIVVNIVYLPLVHQAIANCAKYPNGVVFKIENDRLCRVLPDQSL